MAEPPVGHQARSKSTIRALIDATVRELAERGEAGFRLEKVLQETGTSKSSLYHHFTSRDGLIEAATVVAFRAEVEADVEAIRLALTGALDTEDLLARLAAVTRAAQSPARDAQRRQRLRILGSAMNRPELASTLGREQGRLTDELAAVVRDAQDRGIAAPGRDARTLATFVQAFTFGRVLGDIDPTPLDGEAWMRLVDTVVRVIVTTPDDEAGGLRSPA